MSAPKKKVTYAPFDKWEYLDSIPVCHAFIKVQEEEIAKLRAGLQRISLGSQNSQTSKEDLGREARKVLEDVT